MSTRTLSSPDDTVHPTSLDWRLALQLHTKFDKERSSSLKVVDNDADVVRWQKEERFPRPQVVDEFGRALFDWASLRSWLITVGRWDNATDRSIDGRRASRRLRKAKS